VVVRKSYSFSVFDLIFSLDKKGFVFDLTKISKFDKKQNHLSHATITCLRLKNYQDRGIRKNYVSKMENSPVNFLSGLMFVKQVQV